MDRADVAVEQWARERPDLAHAADGDVRPPERSRRTRHARAYESRCSPKPGCNRASSTFWRRCADRASLIMLSPTQLYEAAMISSGGMTDRLDRLERAGLVERRPDPKDRRGKLIALTDAGKRLIDETIGRHVANEERLLSVADPGRAGNARRAAQEADRRALGPTPRLGRSPMISRPLCASLNAGWIIGDTQLNPQIDPSGPFGDLPSRSAWLRRSGRDFGVGSL